MDILKKTLKVLLSLLLSLTAVALSVLISISILTQSNTIAAIALAAAFAAVLALLIFMWRKRYLWCFWTGSTLLLSAFIFIATRSSMITVVIESEQFKPLEGFVTYISSSLIVMAVVLMVLAAVVLIFGSIKVSRLNKAEGVETISILNKMKKNRWRR